MKARSTQSELYRSIRSAPSIRSAWNRVASNGRASISPITVAEVQRFSGRADQELQRIKRRLARGSYAFSLCKPVIINRHTKPRPIMVAQIDDRIVQRAILDAIAIVPGIKAMASNPWSFGTSSEGGVGAALVTATRAIQDGYTHFARSDIHGFYRNIVRGDVIDRMRPHLPDDVVELLEKALNAAFDPELVEPRFLELFPGDETGIAQGSPLSALSGNVLLHEFDAAMNDRGVRCIRYADDFVLLAKDRRRLQAAMRSAVARLDTLGLRARDPFDPASDPEKAQSGLAVDGFDFLGCHVRGTQIAPTKAAKKKLLERVRSHLQDGLSKLPGALLCHEKPPGLANVLGTLQSSLRAWGKAFAFCTDVKQMYQLDDQIDHEIAAFLTRASRLLRDCDQRAVRLMLGVGTLASTLDVVSARPSTHATVAA